MKEEIKQLTQLIEECKKDKRAIKLLKETAVRCKMYEFAADLRAIERESFPEPPETTAAKEEADQAELLFRMVDIKTEKKTAWLLWSAFKAYGKKKGKFSLQDAAQIQSEASRHFAES